MISVTSPRCPICRRELAPRSFPSEGQAASERAPSPHPFCSARCKLIDLGNWLDGSYRIPGPTAFSDDDEDGDGTPLPS